MPIDSEEQKEILLGNKQLLSVFFIVVVLLGVSFTIGYVIGKNTATMHGSSPAPAVAQLDSPSPKPQSPTQPDAEKKTEKIPPVDPTAPDKHPGATHLAKDYTAQDPEPVSPQPGASQPDQAPATGTYLQVAALKLEDASRIAKMLRTRGYPAKVGDSSKEGLFRVLVGPFKNMGDLSESKQKLKASGMESFIVR